MAKISIPCEIAITEFHRTRKNVERFWNLLYACSAVAAVTIIIALISAMRSDASSTITAGLASIMAGGGMAVLIRMKTSAVTELRRAQAAVRSDCVGTGGNRGSEDEPEVQNEVYISDVILALTEI